MLDSHYSNPLPTYCTRKIYKRNIVLYYSLYIKCPVIILGPNYLPQLNDMSSGRLLWYGPFFFFTIPSITSVLMLWDLSDSSIIITSFVVFYVYGWTLPPPPHYQLISKIKCYVSIFFFYIYNLYKTKDNWILVDLII